MKWGWGSGWMSLMAGAANHDNLLRTDIERERERERARWSMKGRVVGAGGGERRGGLGERRKKFVRTGLRVD